MKICYANKYLTGNIMLYPMKGFYLLSLPISDYADVYEKALIDEKGIALIGKEIVLMVQLNPKVVNILRKQIAISKEHPNTVLAILINKQVEGATVNDVTFARYDDIDIIERYVSAKQLTALRKNKEEVEERV